MTLVEVLIAILVSLTVMGSAWVMFASTQKQGRKSQALSGAVQAGAMLLQTLQDDVANLVPADRPEDTMFALNDPATGLVTLTVKRLNPGSPIDFDSREYDPVVQEDERTVLVRYLAEPDATTGLYRLSRVVEGAEERAMRFGGIFATHVRFSPVSPSGSSQHYMRVSLRLVGENVRLDDLPPANRPKPFLLTSLFHIPLRPHDLLSN